MDPKSSLHESQERFTYCLDLSYIVYHCGDVKELHQKALVSGAKLQMTWPARYYKTGFAALTALVDLGGDEDVLVVAFRGTVGISEWMEYRSLIKHKFRTLFNETDKVVLPIWMDVLDRVSLSCHSMHTSTGHELHRQYFKFSSSKRFDPPIECKAALSSKTPSSA